MEETSKNNETAQLGIGAVSTSTAWKLKGHSHQIADNGRVLPKVGRKSATASPKQKSLIVALMLNLGWAAPLLAIHC